MNRREVLRALLAGGTVATLSGIREPLTEDEFCVLTACAIVHEDMRTYPATFHDESGPALLMADMAKRGLLEYHDAWKEGHPVWHKPDGEIVGRWYEATPYGRSVLAAHCEATS